MHTSITSSEQVCARLKKIGYSQSKSMKLYGEVLELLSDPYPEGDGFVVDALSPHTSKRQVRSHSEIHCELGACRIRSSVPDSLEPPTHRTAEISLLQSQAGNWALHPSLRCGNLGDDPA